MENAPPAADLLAGAGEGFAPPAGDLFSRATAPVVSAWSTGDYKVSAIGADHGDWLICDSTAIDPKFVNLIALVGANRPDARGRTLVMKGTHTDVDVIGDNEGSALADRRMKHKHTVVQPTVSKPLIDWNEVQHRHTEVGFTSPGTISTVAGGGTDGFGTVNSGVSFTGITSIVCTTNPVATGGTVGDQTGTPPVDTAAFVVAGNLFIHT